MKKTNKGFSMVELIIVIAIMAILAGALAPALIKYINKSRLSTDVSNAQQLASAIQEALSTDKGNNAASDRTTENSSAFYGAQGADMQTELASILSSAAFQGKNGDGKVGKAKKDLGGNTLGQQFFIELQTSTNSLNIWVGQTDADHLAYPTVGSSLTD